MGNKKSHKPAIQSSNYVYGNSQFSISCPCQECPNRKVGCHDNCAAYKAFQKDVAKANKTIRKNSLIVKDKFYYTNLMNGGGNKK